MQVLTATALVLTFATSRTPEASAQNAPGGSKAGDKATRGDASDKQTDRSQTVRGVIAGVTAVGETHIDYSTHKAQVAEMDFLTVIGSPENADRSDGRDQDKGQGRENAGSSGSGHGRRHNLYVLWLSPKTKVCDRSEGEKSPAKTLLEDSHAFEKVEVGDRVEVTFNCREMPQSQAADQETEHRMRRHGRHRVYFGDATSLSILAAPAPERDAKVQGDRDDDKDRIKSKDAGKDRSTDK